MTIPKPMQMPRAKSPPKSRQGIRHRKVGVLVLGMHRSGSSVLSRLLGALGCDMPKSLLTPTEANQKGYWESRAVMELNDALLASAGSKWDDCLPFNDDWYNSPFYEAYLGRARAVIHDEYAGSPLFVLKDPRNCRIARFWLDVLGSENFDPAVVIGLRNPMEVAQSLHARDGMPIEEGLLLWLRHMLDAEAQSRGRPRVVAAYEQALDDWRSLAENMQQVFGFSWPKLAAITSFDYQDYVDASLRHEAVSAEQTLDNVGVAGWVRDTYRILLKWSDNPESCNNAGDMQKLDVIRQAFGMAVLAFSPLLLSGGQHRARIASIESELDCKQVEIARMQEQLASETQPHAALRTEQGQHVEQLREAGIRVDAGEAERKGLTMQIVDLQEHEAEHVAAMAKRDGLIAELGERRSEAEARLQELVAQAAAADSTREQLQHELAAAFTRNEDGEAERKGLLMQIVDLHEHEKQFIATIAEREASIAELDSWRTSTEGRLETLAAQNEATGRERDHLQAKLAETVVAWTGAQAHLDAVAAQLEQSRAERGELEQALAQAREELVQIGNLRNELAQQTSRLEQRGEELDQAWSLIKALEDNVARLNADAEAQLAAAAAQDAHVTAITGKLGEANGWVFRLAGERRELELNLARQTRQRAREQDERLRALAAMDRLEWQAANARREAKAQIEAAMAAAAAAPVNASIGNAASEELSQTRKALAEAEKAAQAERERAARAEPEIAALAERIHLLEAEAQDMKRRAEADSERIAEVPGLTSKISDRIDEIVILTGLLRQAEGVADSVRERQDWLLSVNRVITRTPAWWRYMPGSWVHRKQAKRLKDRGLFDADRYLQLYPDVARAGHDALQHYIHHGMAENRVCPMIGAS